MNVLHIDTGHEMRGGQWQVHYLMRGLTDAGVSSTLLAPPTSGLLQAAVAQRQRALPLTFGNALKLAHRADLIHAHDARAHTLGLFLRRPLVVSRRVAFPPKRGIASRWKYRRAARFLAVSEYVAELLRAAGVPPHKISVVYDGVPVPEAAAHSGPGEIIALDSADPGKCRPLIERASAAARVPVHFSANLTRDLGRAAAFLYISESEGLGSAALLAMAAAVPVIASRIGGLPEAVEHGVTGVLVANEPAAIAAAIRHLAEDPALASEMGRRGCARVREHFTIERMVTATIAAYERVLR